MHNREITLPPEVHAELVDVLLKYNGTPRERLFEYPHRDDDSRRYIQNAKTILDKIIEQVSRVATAPQAVVDEEALRKISELSTVVSALHDKIIKSEIDSMKVRSVAREKLECSCRTGYQEILDIVGK